MSGLGLAEPNPFEPPRSAGVCAYSALYRPVAERDHPGQRHSTVGRLDPMTDWADWGTSIGTLVLAGATFAALRSSNRSARIAERALLAGLRPLLMPSRPEDPGEHVQFADGRVLEARAGRALVDAQDSVIYLAIPLRNVGSGIAVLRGYDIEAETAEQAAQDPQGAARHRRGDPVPDPAVFAEQQRDLYVPPGNLGFWQAALRDPGSKRYQRTEEAIRTAGRITVDLLYTDHEAGQPGITRFVLLPGDAPHWRCDVTRHWSLDHLASPRPR
jgi:hypothetical protein